MQLVMGNDKSQFSCRRDNAVSCHACLGKDVYILALENYVATLEAVLKNSERSLAAQGRKAKQARAAVKAVKGKMEE